MAQQSELPPGPDLGVEIAGVRFPNPLILASGILGTDAGVMERVARSGAGGITSKSAGPRPRSGHANPSCIDWGPGLLNAIGLANPGAEAEVEVLAAARRRLAPLGVPLIASVFADSPAGFARVAATLAQAEPDLLELNVSCPNVASEVGEPFAAHADTAAAVTAAVRAAVAVPLVVKLAPNVADIGAIARAVVDAGAAAICAVNTMPGMVIDIDSGRPILANGEGGVSGAALGPVAVRAVYEVARAVDVPIIGTGGVASGADALEMIMAGATAVGIGSAVYGEGMGVFARVAREMGQWLAQRGMTLDEARGRAHRDVDGPDLHRRHLDRPADPRRAGMVRTKALPAPARVAALRRENRRTVTITLDASASAQPGQFAMLWLPGRDEKPFSFLDGDPLRFTVAAVGPFSRALCRLDVGDTLWWRGPFGSGFSPPGMRPLLVGGGYGVAPLAFLARRAVEAGTIRAAIGAATAEDLLLVSELEALGVEVRTATEDGSAGQRGLVTEVVTAWWDEAPPDGLYACGPHGMLEAVEKVAALRGAPAQLAWEAYMRCGIGICGSCVHRGRLLCVEGPVLDARTGRQDLAPQGVGSRRGSRP